MLSQVLARRLQKFYKSYSHEMPSDINEIWSLNNISTSHNRVSVHDVLLNGKTDQVSRILSSPQETDLYYGMDSAAITIQNRKQLPKRDLPKPLATYLISSLIELGLVKLPTKGIISVPKLDKNCVKMIVKLIRDAREQLDKSYSLMFPKGFNDASNSIEIAKNEYLNFRAINAMLHSIKTIRLLDSFNCKSVIEIGPGTGRTLLNLYKSGVICSGIDIPLSIVGQALFFAETIGEDCFIIPGEDDLNLTSSDKIRLYAPSEAAAAIPQYQLALNIDSFTEIEPSIARHYASLISNNAYLFYSVNHESNTNSVLDYFVQFKILPAIRSTNIWNGYIEELFVNQANAPFSALAP